MKWFDGVILWFVAVLRNEKTWSVVSVIAGAVAAVAALVAVRQTSESHREQLRSARPYFTVKDPGIKADSLPYRIQITMVNMGGRVASDLFGNIDMMDQDFKGRPASIGEFSVANEIPPNIPTPYYISVSLPVNMPPQYIVMHIRYKDPIVDTDFSQDFFMRWEGVRDGKTPPDFVHASLGEKNKIAAWLRERAWEDGAGDSSRQP